MGELWKLQKTKTSSPRASRGRCGRLGMFGMDARRGCQHAPFCVSHTLNSCSLIGIVPSGSVSVTSPYSRPSRGNPKSRWPQSLLPGSLPEADNAEELDQGAAFHRSASGAKRAVRVSPGTLLNDSLPRRRLCSLRCKPSRACRPAWPPYCERRRPRRESSSAERLLSWD